MKRYLVTLADRMQRAAARSRLLVRLAVLVRNQCRCIIKYRLAESPDVNETGELWLRRAIAPECRYFADVGANVGDWLGEIARLKAGEEFDAVAYEPSSGAFERLAQRFAAESRIVLRNCAAADASGDLAFFEERGAGKGSSLVPGFLSSEGSTRIVRTVRLDEDVAALGWERVDFLKIDAEGYDMRVMAGARRLFEAGRIGAVQFEYNRAWQLAGDTLYGAMQFLRGYGYEVYVLKREGLYTLDYALYEEFFEYANFVALGPRFAQLAETHFRGTI